MSETAVLPPPQPELVQQTLLARAKAVEERVCSAYAGILGTKFSSGLTLASVGGFGRRELFPYSDVDILLLAANEAAVPKREFLAPFLQDLWDAGLRPSHSVHTLDDCVIEHAENAEFTISLLDRRYLIGDWNLYQTLDLRFRQFLEKKAGSLSRKISTLAEERRSKYQRTIYHLEPNIKESPGGLRDLQTARWLQMVDPHEGMPNLSPAFDYLAAIRLRLHETAGRDNNVLSFDAQEQLSDNPAQLMRDYYRYARVIDRSAQLGIEHATEKPGSLLGRFHEWRSRLSTSEFSVVRERVLLRNPQPPSNLSLFEFVARHDLRLAPNTVDRLNGFVPTANWADWKRLLGLPHASIGLRAMQESGVIGNALPEWRHIENLVIRDFYHRYTVDEHTLVAIGLLESVSDGRFKDLFAEIDDPALVRFALLMHDIGKGSGREHDQVSLEVAEVVMDRLGAPTHDRETVKYLVRHHLVLSSVMSSRDLYDESTARMLADHVGTIERLKLLTMLTYADISAVNPQAMTPWRLEQLWRVYCLAHDELTRELETERIHVTPGKDMGSERASFLEGLPTRYLRIHSQEEIDGHFALYKQLETRPVAVEILHTHGFYTLTLLTKDRERLFASIAGAISSFGLNILKAEAFSNESGVVLDSFTFSDPHRTLELNPPEVDRLRGIVRKVVEGKQEAERLLKGRPKPILPSRKAQFEPRISVNNEASDAATLVELVAEDRPGLLYDLARTFSNLGCNIEVVMIDTEAHKALDVFYVTAQGKKLDAALEEKLKKELLEACAGSE